MQIKSDFNDLGHERSVISYPKFVPHPLLPTGYLQTVVAHFIGKPLENPAAENHILTLDDGDQLLIRVDRPTTEPKRVVTLFHGLCGSSESSYMVRLSGILTAAGVAVVRFNHRTCGTGKEALARQIYHAGRTADVAAALNYVANLFPRSELLAVGFSLSGNTLLKLLGTWQQNLPISRALAVCPPIDLELCSLAFNRLANRPIDQYFAAMLRRNTRDLHRAWQNPPPELPLYLTVRRFDQHYTAPKAGFRDRSHYYSDSSAAPHLSKIKLPTAILAAHDDPLIPRESFDTVPENVAFRLERAGGHMGFISAKPTQYGTRRWLDAAVADWVLG
jgi:predicted alpha/beta-fold hydrolase